MKDKLQDLSPVSRSQWQRFGALLRDRRNAAKLSRLALAHKAKLSEATIKFIETARHPPSRATLIRLIGVPELKLTWGDAPGSPPPPATPRSLETTAPPSHQLNCLLTPTSDPVQRSQELGRLLQGAGGRLEQASAYLDPQSAAAYLALCRQSALLASLRACTPLAEAARRIVQATGPVALQLIALGSGEASLEIRLVQHLVEAAHVPHVDLCLLDASPPMLACGQQQATETLTTTPQVRVWSMQCHFRDLPLYTGWVYGEPARPRARRVLCMLGGSFADLEHEVRFFQHALLPCARGDLLLLDIPVARVIPIDPQEIKRRDKQWTAGVSRAEAAWLGGPIWRHCRDVARLDFHWNLDTHGPIAGSYALEAMATVQLRSGAVRQFSMYQFRRYLPDRVAACLRSVGWDEVGTMPFGPVDHSSSLRLFCKRTESPSHE